MVLVTVIFAHLTAIYFGLGYSKFFPNAIGSGGIFLVPREFGYYVAGLGIAYIFFLTLLFTSFGGAGKSKYWWIGILLIPALALEVYLDLAHIYFPVLLALLGWGIGLGIRALVGKFKVAKLGS